MYKCISGGGEVDPEKPEYDHALYYFKAIASYYFLNK